MTRADARDLELWRERFAAGWHEIVSRPTYAPVHAASVAGSGKVAGFQERAASADLRDESRGAKLPDDVRASSKARREDWAEGWPIRRR